MLFSLELKERSVCHVHFISSDCTLSLQIYFKTNKGRSIGPYGTETDIDKMNFKASYNGAPLLYAEGVKGLWIYKISFFFHGTLMRCDMLMYVEMFDLALYCSSSCYYYYYESTNLC